MQPKSCLGADEGGRKCYAVAHMPEQIHKKTITSRDGLTIYYETTEPRESAATLFLVHGIGGDCDGWQFVRSRLIEEGLGTIALDLRGHGYSSHPRSWKNYDMERVLEDISTILAAERPQTTVLVGHSGGAVVALSYATKHAEFLAALVSLAGSYTAPAFLGSPILKAVTGVAIAIGALISPPATRPWHSRYPLGKHHQDFEWWGLTRTIYHNSLRSYLLLSRAFVGVDLRDELSHISCPTLLVAGEADTIYPPHIAEEMRTLIPNAELVRIPGANHPLPLNEAGPIADCIISFLRRTEGIYLAHVTRPGITTP